MKKVLVRAASGIIYIVLVLGCFFAGIDWFTSLVLCLAALAVEEASVLSDGPVVWRRCLLPMLDLLATCAVILSLSAIIPCWTAVATIIIRCAAQLYTHSQEPMRRLGTSLVIITTMGVGLGTMLAMAEAGKVVLAVLFFIWINDTGAYCVGSLFGRHKLFVRISPNKTWEGFLGGLLLCVGASAIFCHCLNGWFAFLPQPHYWQWATIACATVLFATWGDLVESLAKRSLGGKDSGRLIPGHGGILDRIDSLLMAMPAIWCIMKIFNLL